MSFLYHASRILLAGLLFGVIGFSLKSFGEDEYNRECIKYHDKFCGQRYLDCLYSEDKLVSKHCDLKHRECQLDSFYNCEEGFIMKYVLLAMISLALAAESLRS